MTPAEMAALHARVFTTPRPWSEAEISETVASPFGLLVEVEGGFALGRIVADEAELLTIAVQPERQGQGIGAALMTRFLAAARARGAAQVFLEVAETNGAARALYRKAGFAETGRRRGYYHLPQGGVVDAILMGRALLPDF